MQGLLSFLQNELLGMKWLDRLMAQLVAAAGLDPEGRLGGSIRFFLYDTIKILVLLGCLILIISYIQSYFPPERTRRILGRFQGLAANCLAALLGTVTPFCSCSSIPLFMGFTRAGLPLGVTFSFLTAELSKCWEPMEYPPPSPIYPRQINSGRDLFMPTITGVVLP